MKDLADRLKSRVQLTTDVHRAYLTAVEDVFGGDIDYAMLGLMVLLNQQRINKDTAPPNVPGLKNSL